MQVIANTLQGYRQQFVRVKNKRTFAADENNRLHTIPF